MLMAFENLTSIPQPREVTMSLNFEYVFDMSFGNASSIITALGVSNFRHVKGRELQLFIERGLIRGDVIDIFLTIQNGYDRGGDGGLSGTLLLTPDVKHFFEVMGVCYYLSLAQRNSGFSSGPHR